MAGIGAKIHRSRLTGPRPLGRRIWACFCIFLLMSCSPMAQKWPMCDCATPTDTLSNPYPIGYPAFSVAAEDVAGDRSPHFNYSLVVATYRLMVSHKIPLNEKSIAQSVNYLVRAREIAGPRVLFDNGTRIINILHECDAFNNLFAPGSVIRKEIGLGARAQNIWTFQGPAEVAPALKAIAASKGPTTIYIYAHGIGHTIRLSDFESLHLSELAEALKQRGEAWVNVLADECDGVVTNLPAALRRLGADIPSYIVSSTPRGAMARGSQLLNALSGTATGTGTYFVDPSRLEFEDLAKSQDFVLVWTPTRAQQRQLERVWPFPNMPMNVDDAESYPAGVWELADYRMTRGLEVRTALAAIRTL